MNNKIEEYKSIMIRIADLRKEALQMEDEIISKSSLKIGDVVERDRGIESEVGVQYRISSVWFDSDDMVVRYGIKLIGDDSAGDTFCCILLNDLKKLTK